MLIAGTMNCDSNVMICHESDEWQPSSVTTLKPISKLSGQTALITDMDRLAKPTQHTVFSLHQIPSWQVLHLLASTGAVCAWCKLELNWCSAIQSL